MKSILKKIMAVVLTLTVAFGLAACGETETKAPETTEAPTTTAPETTEEPTTTVPEETKLEGKELLKWYANEFVRITNGKELDNYEPAVQAYERRCQDKGRIVFFGSSLFTRWSAAYNMVELEDDILSASGEKICLNHGIGGSNIAHNIYFYKRMIKNYEPKAVCLSCTGNNNSSYNFSEDDMVLMIEYFCELVRQDFPGIRIYFGMSQKKERESLNERIKEYAAGCDDIVIVPFNIKERYEADPESHPGSTDVKADCYIEDGVHFTPLGYKYFKAIWEEALADELK